MQLARSKDARVQRNAIHALFEMSLSGAQLHPTQFCVWLIGSRALQPEIRGFQYHPCSGRTSRLYGYRCATLQYLYLG